MQLVWGSTERNNLGNRLNASHYFYVASEQNVAIIKTYMEY